MDAFLGNVRVADSSVFPFEFAAHVRSYFLPFSVCYQLLTYCCDKLGSATYGVAEQAAALIQTNSYDVQLNAVSSTSRLTTSNVLALLTTAMILVQQLL